jgi:hypothetical protein
MKAPITFENGHKTASVWLQHFLFQWRTTLFLCVVLQTVFLCQPSCVNWWMSRKSATVAHSGGVRTDLNDRLCYHVTKHCSLHSWIINSKSNTGSFRAPSCSFENHQVPLKHPILQGGYKREQWVEHRISCLLKDLRWNGRHPTSNTDPDVKNVV